MLFELIVVPIFTIALIVTFVSATLDWPDWVFRTAGIITLAAWASWVIHFCILIGEVVHAL